MSGLDPNMEADEDAQQDAGLSLPRKDPNYAHKVHIDQFKFKPVKVAVKLPAIDKGSEQVRRLQVKLSGI